MDALNRERSRVAAQSDLAAGERRQAHPRGDSALKCSNDTASEEVKMEGSSFDQWSAQGCVPKWVTGRWMRMLRRKTTECLDGAKVKPPKPPDYSSRRVGQRIIIILQVRRV